MDSKSKVKPSGKLIIIGLLMAVVITAMMYGADYAWVVAATAGITTLCAFWWMTEAIPIPATSLIPFAAFPILGVVDAKTIATRYGHDLILLLLGGFLLSKAMEKSGAHKRLAIGMVKAVGGKKAGSLVLGFMLASAVLSMWISNTATALMLLPVVLAVLDQVDEKSKLAIPLLLAVAYGANVGGIGTPIGTPPNAVFMGIYGDAVRAQPELNLRGWDFTRWMSVGIPIVLVLLPLIWVRLTWGIRSMPIHVNLPKSEKWESGEKRVMVVFAVTAGLWILRSAPGFGYIHNGVLVDQYVDGARAIGGWTGLIDYFIYQSQGKFTTPLLMNSITDSTIALLMVVVMFIVPNGKQSHLLDWETAVKIPWGILLLFGGGLAIAEAFSSSGLSEILGQMLAGLNALPVYFVILIICLAVTFLTEVTSNTATTNVLMPILLAAGIQMQIDPAIIMIPATISASCAFMLPVATPPNAVMFGTEMIPIRKMMSEGFILNIVGAILIATLCYLLI